MSWRDFFAAVIGDLAWPIAVLLLAILFKERLGELFSRITDWEGFGQKVSFGKKLAETEANAEVLDKADAPTGIEAAQDESTDLAVDSEENPSFVILSSWERVTSAVADLAGSWTARGLPAPRSRSQGEMLRWMQRQHAVDDGVLTTIESLRQLRNAVAHGKHNPVPGEAITYAEIAGEVAGIIIHAAQNGPAKN